MGRKVIIHVINGLATGGAESMLLKLLSRADRTRFEPIVISLLDKGSIGPRIEELGVPVFALNMTQGVPSLRSLVRLGRILRDNGADVLQGWMYHANLAVALSRWLISSNVPLVWNVRHSLYEYSRERLLTKLVIGLCARISATPRTIIYNSGMSARQHAARGFRSSAALVIPNGFDTRAFRPDSSRRAVIRKELGIAEDAFVIGLVARHHPIKDHKNFLIAAAAVAERHSNVHFLLVGRDMDERKGPIACQVAALRLDDRVSLLGERSDIASLNAALDVAVSSSWSEAFSNTVGEAMACGVPCVVTDVGDSRVLVGDTGIVVQPGAPGAMAEALSTLLVMPASERRQMGLAARQRIEVEFTLEKITGKYEAVYEALCGRNINS
jgi:glycosyltransferase involved in cell wall biosynthesis